MKNRRVQVQGIQVFRLIYLSEGEFEFLKSKRLEFLKKVGYFFPQSPNSDKKSFRTGLSEKREALGSPISRPRIRVNEDLKTGIHRYTPCYEPSNMIYTRDSLYWSWRRVREYYRDFLGIEDEDKRKKEIRIDPQIRK